MWDTIPVNRHSHGSSPFFLVNSRKMLDFQWRFVCLPECTVFINWFTTSTLNSIRYSEDPENHQPSTMNGILKNHQASTSSFYILEHYLIYGTQKVEVWKMFLFFSNSWFSGSILKIPGSFSRFFPGFFFVKHAIFWQWRFQRFWRFRRWGPWFSVTTSARKNQFS